MLRWIPLPFVLSAGLLAQEPTITRVPDAPSCASCKMSMKIDVTLATNDVAYLQGEPSGIEVDGRGRFWVAEFGELSKVYQTDGKFLQFLGRKGGGPGEFAGPFGFSQLPGDSMLVFDSQGNMVSVVDPDFRVRRTIALPGSMYPAVPTGWPAKAVFSGDLGVPSAAGWPLHLVGTTSNIASLEKSFGYGNGERLPNQFGSLLQRMARSAGGTFWSMDRTLFRFYQWSAGGVLLRGYERRPQWFAERSKSWMGNATTPPPPLMTGIFDAGDGNIWIYGSVAGKNWKTGWPSMLRNSKEVKANQVHREKLYQSYVEVIDSKTGRLLMHQVLPWFVNAVLADGRVATYHVDNEDVPRVGIATLKLTK